MHRLFTGAFSISRLATPLLAALLALAAPGAGLAQAPLARDIGSIRAVNRIPPGTRVRFPSGAEVPLGALLGHGQTTAVYAHGEEPDLAVRIPLLEKGYANSTWRGAELLEALAVPHATIREFSRDEYLLVDRVTPHPTIQLKHLFDPALSEAERGELREALRDFARRLAPLQELGDFRLEQVVYGRAPDGKLGFRLLDWLAGSRGTRIRAGSRCTKSSRP